MVASPAKSVSEILKRMEMSKWDGCLAEWKYDGERLQVHATRFSSAAGEGEDSATRLLDRAVDVKLYARSTKTAMGKYPDVAELVKRWLPPEFESVILDGEVVAVNDAGELLPFQALLKRKRKASLEDIDIKVGVFLFDCLMLNGESLLDKPLHERKKALDDIFAAVKKSPSCQSASSTVEIRPGAATEVLHLEDAALEIDDTFASAVVAGTEGLIVKNRASTYLSGKRCFDWLKLKKDYVQKVGLCDTIDGIVLGVMFGTGKNSGIFSSFLLGVHGVGGKLQSLCRVGSGFRQQDLKELRRKFSEESWQKERPEDVDAAEELKASALDIPDVWLKPEYRQVWEIRAADLTISPKHSCGLGAPGRNLSKAGISLRFPRWVGFREDKGIADASTYQDVLLHFDQQEAIKRTRTKSTTEKRPEPIDDGENLIPGIKS